MFLGIEIGGTKLQLGIGDGRRADLVAVERRTVDPSRGAAGILEQIESAGAALVQRHRPQRIGIGFGGPVSAATGQVTKSHQIGGWEGFPLVEWCRQAFHLPTTLGNDCDAAALAEATYGAGRGAKTVLYVTVGTGVGGGLVIDGKLYGTGRPAVAEIGHLRPGLHEDRPEATVESIASGWGIATRARMRVSGEVAQSIEHVRPLLASIARQQRPQRLADAELTDEEYKADLMQRADEDPDKLTAKMVAQAAADGNEIAREVLGHACQTLGWAIAQTITLVAPDVVVVGGGVSLIGEPWFLAPVREEVARYVFPPLLDSYRIVPAELGELAVVHGAVALAAGSEDENETAARQ
jgi:glucokinase